MSIHGPIEGDPGLDPLYDAVGRALEAATYVETWLNILGGWVADIPFDKKPWSQVSETVTAAINDRLKPEDRVTALNVVTEGERLLGIRHGLVHGVWNWGSTRDGTPGFRTQRPPRGKEAEMIGAPNGELVEKWITTTFTRQGLLDFANECQIVGAMLQGHGSHWAEHLHADSDDRG